MALCTCAAEKPMTDADGKEDHQKGEATIEWEVAVRVLNFGILLY